MGIEISKIENAELQKLAHLKDANNNGYLENDEITIFKEEAAKKASTEDFNQAMGLYTTNPVSTTEAVDPTTGMSEKNKKAFHKNEPKTFINDLKEFAEAKKLPQDLLTYIDSVKSNIDPKQRQAIVDVFKALEAEGFTKKLDDQEAWEFTLGNTTSDKVGKKHKEMEAALKAKGLDTDLHKNILKQLEEMAKNQIKEDAMSTVADYYSDEMLKPENKDLGIEDLMEKVKEQAKKDGVFKDDIKDAYKHFDQPMVEAYDTVYEYIAKTGDLTNGRKVQDQVEKDLRKDGKWDKYTKRALLGDRNIFKRAKAFVTRYKNDGLLASEVQATRNNVEAHKTQTTDEVMNTLDGKKKLVVFPYKKNRQELYNELVRTGLITVQEDGKCDLTKLSNLIGLAVGKDYELNREAKKDSDIAEILNAKTALRELGNLDDGEVKELVRLCGYKVEGKDIGKAISNGLLGLAAGYGVGYASITTAGATFKNTKYEIPAEQISEDITEQLKEQMAQSKLPEGVIVDAVGNIVITIDGMIEIPKLAGQLGKLGLMGAVGPALMGAGLGILRGLEDKGQKPVIPTNFSETTFEEYKNRTLASGTKYAEAAVLIAASFCDETGEWGKDGKAKFIAYLNELAGDRNVLLNRKELIGARLDLEHQKIQNEKDKENGKINDTDNTNNGTDETNNTDETGEACPVSVTQGVNTNTKIEDLTEIHYRKDHKNVGWKEMVEAYYPGLVEACNGKIYGPDGAIRAFQKALCTDEQGNLDKAKLKALYTANDIPAEIKLPTSVKGIARVMNKPVAGAKNNNNTQGTGNGTYIAPMKKVGRDEFVETKEITPGLFIAKDGCNGATASGSTEKEAVERLEKQQQKQYSNRDEYLN